MKRRARLSSVSSRDDDESDILSIWHRGDSSRRIAKKLREDVAFRILGAGNFPDFRMISDFRKRHLKASEVLFV